MRRRIIGRTAAWLAALLAGISGNSIAADSVSFEIGAGQKTKMVRIGAQWRWNQQWWQSNGTHIGGYWDLSLDRWRGDHFQGVSGRTQNINVIGITPVFRLQNDTLRGFYAEAGIGAHLMSDLYDNDGKQLSTRFQFGDHIGIGYVFANKFDVGLKIQHFSNGGIKRPNDGVNFVSVRASYSF